MVVQLQRFHVLSFRGWNRVAGKSQKNQWQRRFSRHPFSFSHLSSYLDRSDPRLTINLVTFLLGSSSLPPGRLSVKFETNNNECPVKLQRRMVMLQADLTWERDVVLGNNAGNEARNRLKAKVEKKGIEEGRENCSSAFA